MGAQAGSWSSQGWRRGSNLCQGGILAVELGALPLANARRRGCHFCAKTWTFVTFSQKSQSPETLGQQQIYKGCVPNPSQIVKEIRYATLAGHQFFQTSRKLGKLKIFAKITESLGFQRFWQICGFTRFAYLIRLTVAARQG